MSTATKDSTRITPSSSSSFRFSSSCFSLSFLFFLSASSSAFFWGGLFFLKQIVVDVYVCHVSWVPVAM